MSGYQYRVTVNGEGPRHRDSYPQDWGRVAELIEARGGVAYLERRGVFDEQLPGTFKVGEAFVSRWEYLARVES